MATKKIDRKLIEFEQIRDNLTDSKQSFITTETNYTKTIKQKFDKYNLDIFFTDSERCNNELKLINMVRSDANKYMDENEIKKISTTDIDFYKFYKDSSHDFVNEVYKVDITSAYWSYAVKSGIVSEKTNAFFCAVDALTTYSTKKGLSGFKHGGKSARLKALGSLATKKVLTEYKDGVMVGKPFIKQNDATTNLYSHVCSEIDFLMSSVAMKYGKACVYYYWDCLFLIAELVDVNEVMMFIKSLGFESHFIKVFIAVDKGMTPTITDVTENIDYVIRKDDL